MTKIIDLKKQVKMEFTINTETKQITLKSECNIIELYETLNKMFTKDELKEYSIKQEKEISIIPQYPDTRDWIKRFGTWDVDNQKFNTKINDLPEIEYCDAMGNNYTLKISQPSEEKVWIN
jgi:hypothetical protein